MTRWRAVLAGAALAMLVEAMILAGTGRITLAGGLAGSALAGYVAGPEPVDGAWHGLLAALLWGTVLVPVAVLLTLTIGETMPFPVTFVARSLSSPGALTTALVLAVTLPNVVAGALGSFSRWRVDDRFDAEGAA